MTSRRKFLTYTGVGAVATAVSPVATGATLETISRAGDAPAPTTGNTSHEPVKTLNGWTLPYTMKNGVKEFHLVAEEIDHEFAPGSVAKCWGYNGSTPGPTIEAVEGDRVRILVTNGLKEHTTIHWHGILLPSGMDGVGGLSQPQIGPGETCAYEFTLHQHGTHMYHHGVQFQVTGSDGGRWPRSLWRPETTEIVGVGQTRDIECIAEPGDWAFHCHMSHHTMNAMGHEFPNTLAMMAGKGPYGNIEMGGMFTMVKVRDHMQRGDYSDPGWYRPVSSTVAARVSSDPDFGNPPRHKPRK